MKLFQYRMIRMSQKKQNKTNKLSFSDSRKVMVGMSYKTGTNLTSCSGPDTDF